MPNLSDLQKKTSIVSASSFIVGYDASDTSQASTGTTITWPATAFQTLAWAVSANYGIQNISPVYTTVNSNSAVWSGGSTVAIPNSSNWDQTYTFFSSQSANNLSVYSTVNSNSANWNYQGTDIKILSSNWQNTYTTVNSNSANWGAGGAVGITGIYYVDSANGNDTTGDGSVGNPYASFTKAYNVGVLAGLKFSIQLARGTYSHNESSGGFLNDLLLSVKGVGATSYNVYGTYINFSFSNSGGSGGDGGGRSSTVLYLSDLLFTFSAIGASNPSGNGGNGGTIWLGGNAIFDTINAEGGDNEFNTDGNGGTIKLENGIIAAGNGGISVNGNTVGTIWIDGCDLRNLSTITNGSTVSIGRSSYNTSVITSFNDLGGNAAYS